MKKQKKTALLFSTILLPLSVIIVQAFLVVSLASNVEAISISRGDVGLPTTNADEALKATLNGVYTIAGVIAVVAIVIAGFMMIIADGDSQKVATARRMIIYAVVGLAVILFAFLITGIIQGIGRK